jgi:hypothetical protein
MKQLNISEYKKYKSEVRSKKLEVKSYIKNSNILRILVSVTCLALLASCAAKKPAEMPSQRGLTLENALAQYKTVTKIDTVMALEYEKNDVTMSGDASLSASPDRLSLRIYYLGFLQGEVQEENGVIKSKPKMDRNKSTILVQGLKDSLFWWNITDYQVSETADNYELRNEDRKVVINKQTLLPVEQTILLDNGDMLSINYAAPAHMMTEDGQPVADNSPLSWYQSRVKIQLRNYQVRINVKSYSVTK